jgi:formate-dependent nitrite reductase membrane component NrfD
MPATQPALQPAQTETRETQAWLPAFTPATAVLKAARPTSAPQPGYYGVPLLKRPTWRWHIAWYFYLEGISAGSFVLASLAQTGDKRLRSVRRAGHAIAFLSFLPCPPLLIADLGDPSRFHHMLRVFKPSSPMNLGTWLLTAYSLPLTLLAAQQAASQLPLKYLPLKVAARALPTRALGWLGLPLALGMASYPGVLLASTSTPLWAKSRFLGALFATSSLSTGVAATTLALAARRALTSPALRRLERIERYARASEAVALSLYLATTGKDITRPLRRGRRGWQFWLGAVGAGLFAPALLQTLQPRRRKPSLGAALWRSALTLAGGFALKWAIVHAGRASAQDVNATHAATQPSANAPGWPPAREVQ